MKSNVGEMMMTKNSLQRNLRKLITRIIISFAIISGIIFYVFVNYQTNEKYKYEALGVINLTKQALDNTFSDAELSLLALEEFIKSKSLDIDKVRYEDALSVIKTGISNASTIFIGNELGEFYRFPERYVADDYNPRNRTWYTNSLENRNHVNWTEPYVDHGTGEFTITASKYVEDDMVIGVDILLSEITKLVNESKIGNDGSITLVNNSGIILASNDSDILGLSWDETGKSDILYSEFTKHSKLKDNKRIYYIEKHDSMGILIIASVSRAEIMQNLIFMSILIIIITLLVILLAEQISLKYSDHIVSPILKLVKTMETIEEGNYEAKCDIESDNDEVEVLINGFNSMIQSIQEKNFEMQALYEELYASEETLQEQYDLLFENKEYISKSEQRYKSIFEASEEGLWDLSQDNHFNFLTPAWYAKFDIDVKNATMDGWLKLIHPEDRERVETELKNYTNGLISYYRLEYRVVTKTGEYIWIEAVGIARYEDGNYITMSGSHQDITDRKTYELKIQDMAYKDDLTKLYNRRYFELQFQNHLDDNGVGTLLLLDIDNFKYINDIYGHTFGDDVLKQYAKRLMDSVNDLDQSLVARYSGNEFIILIRNVVDKDSISFIVNTLIKLIEMPIKSKSKIVKITTSIGITIFPADGLDVEQLIQNADIAMFHAKRVTKKYFHYFDIEIKQNAINEMKIENRLRVAIEEDEFEVYYQPIISIASKKVKGFEALIRWNSKSLGFIYPDSFIPIAEKTGLINEIGFIVLEKSCAFISELNKKLNTRFTIAINISVIQLLEEHFANNVLSIIEKYDVPKELVRLEITESVMLETNENIIAKLFYLKNKKIGISLDDFGTGYSSFNNLIRLPLSGIKIDKVIMKDSVSNEHVFTLLESIVDFAHKINIDVVAEGIENEIYLERSQKMKVDYAQGYHYSRPISGDNIEELIKSIDKM